MELTHGNLYCCDFILTIETVNYNGESVGLEITESVFSSQVNHLSVVCCLSHISRVCT